MTPVAVAAYTLWGEARGEPISGILAVAGVIYTRVMYDAFKSDDPNIDLDTRIPKICLAPKQFSCWQDGAFTQELPDISSFKWQVCQAIATEFYHGFNPLTNATHYYALSMKVAPEWAKGMDYIGVFGHQIFLRDPVFCKVHNG